MLRAASCAKKPSSSESNDSSCLALQGRSARAGGSVEQLLLCRQAHVHTVPLGENRTFDETRPVDAVTPLLRSSDMLPEAFRPVAAALRTRSSLLSRLPQPAMAVADIHSGEDQHEAVDSRRQPDIVDSSEAITPGRAAGAVSSPLLRTSTANLKSGEIPDRECHPLLFGDGAVALIRPMEC